MDAVFETMLVDDGRVRLLDRHLERLRQAGVPDERVADVHVAVLDAPGDARRPWWCGSTSPTPAS